MPTRIQTFLGIAVVVVILGLTLATRIFETTEKGTYQIKQAAVSGTMSAHMEPGLWWQNFGDIQTWPVATTFFFTSDNEEGEARDQAEEVRFNDGSLAAISGTMRVSLPTSESEAIALVTSHGYRDVDDMMERLIRPTVRGAMRLTANLMSARESYSVKRSDYVFWAWDQIQNGLYETEEEIRDTTDLITGKKTSKAFKIIKIDADGNPVRQKNPLEGTGLVLKNFEIKKFVYDKKVDSQIAQQQEAFMAVATARANAEKADAEAKQAEAEGLRKVMTAKYEEEQKKVKAVVEAEKVKEVAEIAGQQRLTVAELDKQAAEQKKQENILLGEGEAKRKELVLAADGALQQKLDTYQKVMSIWAEAYARRQVPQMVIGGGGGAANGGAATGSNTDALNFNQVMTLLVAERLGLDLNIRKGISSSKDKK